jgi:hypothetical protein
MNPNLQEIAAELEKRGEDLARIPHAQVQRWMKSEDTDSLGATYAFLFDPAQVQRVSPPLSFDDVFSFVLRYYQFCLRADPESRWADSRYSAGMDLVRWFTLMWDQKRDRKYFESIKAMLQNLYLTGQPELKKCVEQGVVEHLFERKDIMAFFSDWRDNPQLRPAYDEAKLWVDGGGTSPLTERRQR